jgi:hypothetical protein
MVFAFSRAIFLDVSGERLRYQTAPCGNLARGARTRPAYTAIHGAVLGTASIAPLSRNELPIFLQNALILFARENWDALRMMRNQTTNFRNSAAQFLAGGIAPALVTWTFFRLGVDLASTAFAYVLFSLVGSFAASALLAQISVAGLAYCSAPPIFDFRIDAPTGGGVVIQLGGRQESLHLKRDEQGE